MIAPNNDEKDQFWFNSEFDFPEYDRLFRQVVKHKLGDKYAVAYNDKGHPQIFSKLQPKAWALRKPPKYPTRDASILCATVSAYFGIN